MRVFLDARDLIDLLEGRASVPLETFRSMLAAGGHELALTPTVVVELSAPLVQPGSRTVVTGLLNALEELPLVYLADSRVIGQELRGAVDAVKNGRDYTATAPFELRLDAAIPAFGRSPTAGYLNFPLAEIVWTLAQESPDVFRWEPPAVARLRQLMTSNRSVDPPTAKDQFRVTIRRDLALHRVATRGLAVEALADRIFESPDRCPGTRLGYEVYHQIRRNTADLPKDSDLGDFAHLNCVPYVDLLTLDRRMADYVGRATRSCPISPAGRVFTRFSELIAHLGSTG